MSVLTLTFGEVDGTYILVRTADGERQTQLIQSDWDFPGVARTFGWAGNDGNVDGAREYLDLIAEDHHEVEDPGYFPEERA